MPYKREGKCVYKVTDGGLERIKCHATTEEAVKHMQALNINVGHKEAEDSLVERIADRVKQIFAPKQPEQASFMVWKEASGRTRWLARYSNKFRDNDTPAEIIAESSHMDFVAKIDRKEAEYPVLMLWHIPEWKFGDSDWVAYDDSGFALASGLIDEGYEELAEQVAKQKDVAVSHGMPNSSIARDMEDDTIIVQHVTVEISPLPYNAAANKLTGFYLIEDNNVKEVDMAIPQHKRDALTEKWGINPDLLKQLEDRNAQDAQKAVSEGIEFKEQTEVVEEVATEIEAEVAEVADETPATEQVAEVEQPVYATQEDVATAFAAVINPILAQVKSLTEEVKALKEAQVKPAAAPETVASPLTPVASLAALISKQMSAASAEETAIDGRSALAKMKPKEAKEVDNTGRWPAPFIGEMLSGKNGH